MESKKFGRYEIKGEIGRGGMATVYHAYDPRFEREVALKVLPREMLHDPQFRTRFEREAKTIAMLEHPAIVPVYDFGEEDGQPYFVMRYMTGGSLADRMKQGAMTIQAVAHLYERIAPALDDAHAKGIIHRDLKPGNILFDQFGEPYISDFGIAKIAATQTNVTGSAIIGTPAYMSPEQAQGEGIDGRSDIYGLGVIMFELLTGQQPYHGDTPMSVVIKQITDPIPHILDVMPDLPPAIETVIEKAMAKDREERYSTVKALSEDLNAVAQGESLDMEYTDKTLVSSPRTTQSKRPVPETRTVLTKRGQAPVPVAAPASPRKKTGLWIGLGGGALLVCVAAVAGVFLLKDKLPFLAAPIPTRSPVLRVTDTLGVLQPANTDTPGGLLPPVASDTPMPTSTFTFTPNPTSTVPRLPSLGGADMIAFLSDNEIWVMGVDGSKPPEQITKDSGVKNDLQWAPDGQSLFYINGKCVQSVSLQVGQVTEITCFTSVDFLEAFEISPDGKQVAISVNRALFVVPFDLKVISGAHSWAQLQDMKGCFTYGKVFPNQAPTLGARWSQDGTKIAINSKSAEGGVMVEEIRVFDISACKAAAPQLDNFPATRFSMSGYNAQPVIPSFTWDGTTLFVLNSIFRYDLGYLYEYNMEKMRGKMIDPLKTSCCYTLGRFSPDGSYLLFAYQDINSGADAKTQLYYISYGTIGSGSTYSPLPMPDGFFSVLTNHLDATLRPAIP